MKFLIFGDPEGRIRYPEVVKLTNKFLQKNDFIIFTGDYFSNQLTPYKYFKQGRLFPEMSLFQHLYRKFKIILIFGNKDLRSELIGLNKKREKFNKNIILVERFHGKVSGEFSFFFLNGSDLTNVDISKKARKLSKRINNALKRCGKTRLIELPAEEIEKLRKGYEFEFKLIYDLPYLTDFRFLSKLKEREFDILLTHTPPYMKNSEIICGNTPDLAIFKRDESGIHPVNEKEKRCRKRNVGNREIREFVKKSKSKLVICCHIHEASGIAYLKDKIVINPGSKAALENRKNILPFCVVECNRELTKFKFFLRNWEGISRGEI